MCRSHGQGHRRCKGSAATKARESLRKSINYQAKKAGLAVWEWKVLNPDLVDAIHSTYDDRLKRFETQFGDENCGEKVELPEEKPFVTVAEAMAVVKEPSGFSDSYYDSLGQEGLSESSGVPTETKESIIADIVDTDTPETVSAQSSIDSEKDSAHRYNFAAQGEKRLSNSQESFDDYIESSAEYLKNLNLSKEESHAILCYSNDTYQPVNTYLLNKPLDIVFYDEQTPWSHMHSDYHINFKDENDLIDYTSTLDAALSHRAEQPRIVYRGMNVRSSSTSIKAFSEGKDVTDTQARRGIMEQQYATGSELVFDAYASASDSINVAANWCSAHTSFTGSPTGVIFEIKSSAGVPIAHLSGHQDEREVLLPRGMKFKVTNSYWNSREEDDCYRYDSTYNSKENFAKNGNTLIVQLTEVDSEGNEISDHSKKYEVPALEPRLNLQNIGAN